MSEAIYEVSKISYVALNKKEPPDLIVHSMGLTRSSGWSHGELVPRVYVKPPADGFQEFVFVAEPPTGIRLPVISPIEGFSEMEAPSWLRGVRVHSETNFVERPLAVPVDSMHKTSYDEILANNEDSDPEEDSSQVAYEEDVLVESSVSNAILSLEALALGTTGQCLDFKVLSVSGWPETKTEFKTRCVLRIGGKCQIKTKVPIIYRRTSKLQVIASICLPDARRVESAVKDCVQQAIAAGVLAGALSGSLTAATSALKAYLKTCLAAKGVSSSGLEVKLRQHKKTGKWKKI